MMTKETKRTIEELQRYVFELHNAQAKQYQEYQTMFYELYEHLGVQRLPQETKPPRLILKSLLEKSKQ